MTTSYDFIIVGAGSAGCVLANRLTDGTGHRVLLIEAGGSDSALRIKAPALYNLLWRTKYDWAFYTEPQEHVDRRRMFWPRGKVLGGTSCLNAMVYIRGHRSNYDEWRDLGCEGWGYDDVLPYFRKSEDFLGPPSEFHGQNGPLTVTPLDSAPPASEAFIEAAARVCNVAISEDFNGAEQTGIGRFHHTVRDGARCSTAFSFLQPAIGRRELDILSDTLVSSIIVEAGRAVGVRVLRDGREEEIRAEREVLLCGGSIGSPQLLMLSGVGPADHLREIGIDVVHDLPGVGDNLQDHLLTVVGHEALDESARHLSMGNLALWALRYLMTGRGPLQNPPVDVGGFVPTDAGLDRPNLQFHFVPWGLDAPNTDEARDPPVGRHFSILPSLIYPKSRGSIRLRSTDVRDAPRIDPRYFSEPDDLQLLLDGVKLSREIANAAPLSGFAGKEWSPGAEVNTDDELRAQIRSRVNTIFHPVGTCKMGNDDQAVVDPDLRVRGIAGLRVVDGAIMPTIVGGNTNAPIIMIAERAAERILSA